MNDDFGILSDPRAAKKNDDQIKNPQCRKFFKARKQRKASRRARRRNRRQR